MCNQVPSVRVADSMTFCLEGAVELREFKITVRSFSKPKSRVLQTNTPPNLELEQQAVFHQHTELVSKSELFIETSIGYR